MWGNWSWNGGASSGATSSGSGSSGGGGGDSYAFWGSIASAMLSGASASSQASRDGKDRRQELEMAARVSQRLARIQGDEQRRTIDFESRLGEANRLNERNRMGSAWSAWSAGDNSKPAAQRVARPVLDDYFTAPEQDYQFQDLSKPTKPKG
jgi:hypothetical protein